MPNFIKEIEKYDLNEEERRKLPGSFIKLKEGYTHYELSGSGQAIVLVHGFSTPYFIYDKLFNGLVKNGYKVLRYDLYGRGFSDRVKKKQTVEMFAGQLLEISEKLLEGEQFFLMGTSMGGSVVTAFAELYPEKIKKLFLFAPAGMNFKAPLYMKISKLPVLGDLIFRYLAPKKMLKGIAVELLYSTSEKDYYTEQFAKSIVYKGFSRSLLSSLRNIVLRPDITVPIFKSLNKNKIPVIAIWGTADKTMPYYQSNELKEIVKNIVFYTFEASGHLFIFDEGQRTLDIVLCELKNIEE